MIIWPYHPFPKLLPGKPLGITAVHPVAQGLSTCPVVSWVVMLFSLPRGSSPLPLPKESLYKTKPAPPTRHIFETECFSGARVMAYSSGIPRTWQVFIIYFIDTGPLRFSISSCASFSKLCLSRDFHFI